ncbi:lariat debranching enzyme [Galendromus occidentalis]|uniref:Lariat debranching enzyme n=1 Tax=Galendromus occidentalis TaxID=34638 RepID=A0AAJ6VX95_9ACAR|nr:lariat debranching enzyme [Galendromus occidentalis]
MRIAVAGCGHGELEKMYAALGRLEAVGNFKLDLLLICGDFQANRNSSDLLGMACPPKYRQMCDFHKYYSGHLVAPVLTLVIGGNHEASSYFDELRYGGWLAPNIYYLGTAGCYRIGDLRVAGISGIYKSIDYMKGRYETVPYDTAALHSVYHIRALDVLRLCGLRKVDVMMSHDWPTGITAYGNEQWLRRKKPFFNEDLDSGRLGSPPTRKILDTVKPRYFFSAHLHVRFTALVPHTDGSSTRFLALDKCLPNRDFLQVIELPGESGPLRYDAEWLCILKKTLRFESTSRSTCYDLPNGDDTFVGQDEVSDLLEEWQSDLIVPENFEQTAPPHDPNSPDAPLRAYDNPQTEIFLKKLRGQEAHLENSELRGLEAFVGKSSRGSPGLTIDGDDDSQEGTESSNIVSTTLTSQTPSGKTIKRRNANVYSNE